MPLIAYYMPYDVKDGRVVPFVASVDEALRLARSAKFVDLQFADIAGRLQHVTIPSHALSEDSFRVGVPKLDGSSIRGFAQIDESDMVLYPDPQTVAVLPWYPQELSTVRFICDVGLGGGAGAFEDAPRNVDKRAVSYLRDNGFTSYWGPEVEFFVFDRVTWDTLQPYRGQSYEIVSREAPWSSQGAGYPIRFKEGYYPAPPQDTLYELRSTAVSYLEDRFHVVCDAPHHEVSTAGQGEINIFRDDLVPSADAVISIKYVVKNVAKNMGMVATFMPKPVFGDNASGMHVHMSLWTGGVNAFYDASDKYAELSQTGRYAVGGLLEHARSLAAIVAPTTSSYKRLVPGYEAPVYMAWSKSNRSAAVRIPIYHSGVDHSGEKRLEFRPPDPSSNPYFVFAAMAAAAMDGIKRKIDPGDPVDKNIYELTEDERREKGIGVLPGSLKEAVEALQSDSDYLLPIFGRSLIDKIIYYELKDYQEVSMRPHPLEFQMYFDV